MKNTIIAVAFIFATLCFSSCGVKKTLVKSTDECAVLGFQSGSNVAADDAKYIAGVFAVNFHPANYKVIETERIEKELDKSGYEQAKLMKQQACEVGRRLGVKLVVLGSINKLMDEYVVDVQVIDSVKGITVAFEGNAFQKSDSGREMSILAKKLSSKLQ